MGPYLFNGEAASRHAHTHEEYEIVSCRHKCEIVACLCGCCCSVPCTLVCMLPYLHAIHTQSARLYTNLCPAVQPESGRLQCHMLNGCTVYCRTLSSGCWQHYSECSSTPGSLMPHPSLSTTAQSLFCKSLPSLSHCVSLALSYQTCIYLGSQQPTLQKTILLLTSMNINSVRIPILFVPF